MKAKEYYQQLKDCQTKEEFEIKLSEIMHEFADEVDRLVNIRHAKTHDAIHSIVSEVNNKWHVMVNLSKKEEDKLFGGILNDDGFYLCLCEIKPHYKKYFEKKIKKAMETLEDVWKKQEEDKKRLDNMYIHRCKPLVEITKENITMEYLQCIYALGGYAQNGIPLSHLKPLGQRIALLEYWKKNGINLDEIKEFETDGAAFLDKIRSAQSISKTSQLGEVIYK